jgi:hypothetical protein
MLQGSFGTEAIINFQAALDRIAFGQRGACAIIEHGVESIPLIRANLMQPDLRDFIPC